MTRVGRFLAGVLLLGAAFSLGLAPALPHPLLLALAISTSAAAVYFFWSVHRGPTLPWRIGAWSGVLLATGCGLMLALRWNLLPPREDSLVHQFRVNRGAFESLKQLLTEEAGPVDVAKWGVRRERFIEVPPARDFPRARFEKYLALLARAGGGVAWRGAGTCPETCVIVWSAGWAGDTQHVAVCSLCTPPAKPIGNLDEWWTIPNATGGREVVYRRLDAEWYLRADSR